MATENTFEPVHVRIEGTPTRPYAVISTYDLALIYSVARIRIRMRSQIAQYEEKPIDPQYRVDLEMALARVKSSLISLGLTVEEGVADA